MTTRLLRTPSMASPWFFATLIAFGLVSVQAQSATAQQKPVAVITVSSVNELMQDAGFVGNLFGKAELVQMYKPMILGMTEGLDHSKPIGMIVQTDGMNPGGALCIPVTDLKKLLGKVVGFGISSEDKGDGMLEISVGGENMIAKEAGGWAYITSNPHMLEGLPADPNELFADLTNDYDIGIRLHVQNIPEEYRELAIQQLQQGMEAGFQQGGQSPEDLEQGKALAQLQIQQLAQLINEADEVTLGIALDGEQQRALIDFSLTAVPGSELATQMNEQMTAQKTNFAGFFQPDAAMMMSVVGKVSEKDKAQIDEMFDVVSKQISDAMEKEASLPSQEARDLAQSAIEDFLQAFKATLQAGMMDGGAVVNLAPNALTLVAGGFVGDPSKVESGVKKLAELAEEEPEFPGVKWNAESHGDVNFHTLNMPIPADEEEPRQLFGDEVSVAVGIGSKSAFFALGRDCVEAVKAVMDASAAEPGKTVPPFEMTFALKQIMEVAATFADENEQPQLEDIANMLATQATGRDHVRIVLQPIDNGFRYRFEAEEGVLRSIGMAIEAERNQEVDAGF